MIIEQTDTTVYLELSVVHNQDKTDVQPLRLIDGEATLDSKRFAESKEFK